MKLSRQQEKERAALVKRLADAGRLVSTRFDVMLAELPEVVAPVNEAIREYNLVLAEAAAFANVIGEDFRSDFEGKSERWQEGERGQEAESFIGEWEGFEAEVLPELGILEPELEEKPCHAEALEQLPSESE